MESNDKAFDLSSNQRPQSELDSDQAWAQLTSKYLHNLPQQLDEIRTILEIKDYPTIKKYAHRIKGTSGTYHLETISQSAAQLERSANTRDPDTIVAVINKVKRLVEIETRRLDSLTASSIDSSERIKDG